MQLTFASYHSWKLNKLTQLTLVKVTKISWKSIFQKYLHFCIFTIQDTILKIMHNTAV